MGPTKTEEGDRRKLTNHEIRQKIDSEYIVKIIKAQAL